jgi:dienelactone hydrolase
VSRLAAALTAGAALISAGAPDAGAGPPSPATPAREPASALGETIRFPGDSRHDRAPATLEGVLLRPADPGPFPALVMLHGCAGLRTRQGGVQSKPRFWAEHFRDRGYVTLLVDSFTPRGIDEVCTGRHVLSPVRDRADDARGALRYLRDRPDVQGDRIGLLGWSNGAAATLSVLFDTGTRDRDFRAGVAFYPNCRRQYPGGPEFRPYAPLYILVGGRDDWTPASPCVAMVEHARARGAPITIKVYPDAHHSFDAPASPLRYRPEVRNHNRSDGCSGATVGTDPAARADAIVEVTGFFALELGGRRDP